MKVIVHKITAGKRGKSKRSGDYAPAAGRVSYLCQRGKIPLGGCWVKDGRGKIDIKATADFMMIYHHGGDKKTLHYVISADGHGVLNPKKSNDIAQTFCTKFFPDTPFISGFDPGGKKSKRTGKAHPDHIHVVVLASNGKRSHNVTPAMLSKMQKPEEWCPFLGIKSGKSGVILSRLTAANKLASMTPTEREKFSVRKNKHGETISYQIDGKRVRASKVLEVEKLNRKKTMPEKERSIIFPKIKLPPIRPEGMALYYEAIGQPWKIKTMGDNTIGLHKSKKPPTSTVNSSQEKEQGKDKTMNSIKTSTPVQKTPPLGVFQGIYESPFGRDLRTCQIIFTKQEFEKLLQVAQEYDDFQMICALVCRCATSELALVCLAIAGVGAIAQAALTRFLRLNPKMEPMDRFKVIHAEPEVDDFTPGLN